jgi:uncharacterized protein involved in exopolysaccharide biosynthesis
VSYGEKHPNVVELMRVRATIERQIDDRIDGIITGTKALVRLAERRESALTGLIEEGRKKEIQSQGQMQSYMQIPRKLDRARARNEAIETRLIQEEIDARIGPSQKH